MPDMCNAIAFSPLEGRAALENISTAQHRKFKHAVPMVWIMANHMGCESALQLYCLQNSNSCEDTFASLALDDKVVHDRDVDKSTSEIDQAEFHL